MLWACRPAICELVGRLFSLVCVSAGKTSNFAFGYHGSILFLKPHCSDVIVGSSLLWQDLFDVYTSLNFCCTLNSLYCRLSVVCIYSCFVVLYLYLQLPVPKTKCLPFFKWLHLHLLFSHECFMGPYDVVLSLTFLKYPQQTSSNKSFIPKVLFAVIQWQLV